MMAYFHKINGVVFESTDSMWLHAYGIKKHSSKRLPNIAINTDFSHKFDFDPFPGVLNHSTLET